MSKGITRGETPCIEVKTFWINKGKVGRFRMAKNMILFDLVKRWHEETGVPLGKATFFYKDLPMRSFETPEEIGITPDENIVVRSG